MYPQRRRMVSQALGVGLLLTLVILALSACGGGAGGQEQANARHLPEVGAYPIPMHPGKYRSEEFKPSFSFTVGKGWKNDRQETSDKLAITRGERTAPC